MWSLRSGHPPRGARRSRTPAVVLALCLAAVACGQRATFTTQRAATPSPKSSRTAPSPSPPAQIDLKTAAAALRDASGGEKVRSAVWSAVDAQLRKVRPIGWVEGAWVTPVDLRPVYSAAPVKDAMTTRFGAGRFNDFLRREDLFGVVLTPGSVADSVRIPVGSIQESMAGDALEATMTGEVGTAVVVIVYAGLFLGGLVFGEWLDTTPDQTPPDDPDRDLDGDGLPNSQDTDDDGDGVNDDDDNYPYDDAKSICDCGRPPRAADGDGTVFSFAAGADLAPTFQSALDGAGAAHRDGRLLQVASVGRTVVSAGFG